MNRLQLFLVRHQYFMPWWFKKALRVPSLLDVAEQALERGDHERVQQLLLYQLAHYPDDTSAYMVLGRAALDRQAFPEAVAAFAEVLWRNPQEPWVWPMYGYAALKAGQITVALSALQRARDQAPTNRAILECLLVVAQRIDSAALRQSVERDLIALDPDAYHPNMQVDI